MYAVYVMFSLDQQEMAMHLEELKQQGLQPQEDKQVSFPGFYIHLYVCSLF